MNELKWIEKCRSNKDFDNFISAKKPEQLMALNHAIKVVHNFPTKFDFWTINRERAPLIFGAKDKLTNQTKTVGRFKFENGTLKFNLNRTYGRKKTISITLKDDLLSNQEKIIKALEKQQNIYSEKSMFGSNNWPTDYPLNETQEKSKMTLISLIEKYAHAREKSDGSSKQNVLEEFSKCNEQQAAQIINIFRELQSHYGQPQCITYKSEPKEHIKGLPPFSLNGKHIKFWVNDDSGDQIRIRLATSNTPNCELRDPIIQYKYGTDEPAKLFIVNDDLTLNHVLETCSLDKISELEFAAETTEYTERRASAAGSMTFKERGLARQFKYLDEISHFKCSLEYKHPQGRLDALLTNEDGAIAVEMKFINPDENPLDKLRTAIGQILMYQKEPNLEYEIDKVWVVVNDVNLEPNIQEALQEIKDKTGIEFYKISSNVLVDL